MFKNFVKCKIVKCYKPKEKYFQCHLSYLLIITYSNIINYKIKIKSESNQKIYRKYIYIHNKIMLLGVKKLQDCYYLDFLKS